MYAGYDPLIRCYFGEVGRRKGIGSSLISALLSAALGGRPVWGDA